jgi:DNA-binding beta-propeller fold protein YncE
VNEEEMELRNLLHAFVGEPPHKVSAEAVRRRVTKRRVREAVGIPVAVAALAAVGVTGAFGVVAGPAATHRPAGPTVFVSYPGNHRFSEDLTPISTITNKPGQPLRMGTLGGFASTPDGKTAYVEGPGGAVIPISTTTDKPGKPIPVHIPGGYRPFHITMNPDGKNAYLTFSLHTGSSFSGSIVPINTATNTAGKPIRIYSGKNPFVDWIVFSPSGKTAYVGAGTWVGETYARLSTATVTPLDTTTNKPGTPIHLSHDEADLTITPDGKTLYVASGAGRGRSGYVTPINTATGTLGTPIRLSTGAETLAITPNGKTLYAAGPDAITPISTATNTPGKPIRIENLGPSMAFTPNGKTLYVVSGWSTGATIVPISTATNTAGQPIPVSTNGAFAITPDGKTLYAAALHGVVPISTATNTPGKVIHPADYIGIPALWITP